MNKHPQRREGLTRGAVPTCARLIGRGIAAALCVVLVPAAVAAPTKTIKVADQAAAEAIVAAATVTPGTTQVVVPIA